MREPTDADLLFIEVLDFLAEIQLDIADDDFELLLDEDDR